MSLMQFLLLEYNVVCCVFAVCSCNPMYSCALHATVHADVS